MSITHSTCLKALPPPDLYGIFYNQYVSTAKGKPAVTQGRPASFASQSGLAGPRTKLRAVKSRGKASDPFYSIGTARLPKNRQPFSYAMLTTYRRTEFRKFLSVVLAGVVALSNTPLLLAAPSSSSSLLAPSPASQLPGLEVASLLDELDTAYGFPQYQLTSDITSKKTTLALQFDAKGLAAFQQNSRESTGAHLGLTALVLGLARQYAWQNHAFDEVIRTYAQDRQMTAAETQQLLANEDILRLVLTPNAYLEILQQAVVDSGLFQCIVAAPDDTPHDQLTALRRTLADDLRAFFPGATVSDNWYRFAPSPNRSTENEPAMRWSGRGLSPKQHEIVDTVIGDYFSGEQPGPLATELDQQSYEYSYLDPDGILADAGVRILFLEGLLERIREACEAEGEEFPEDLAIHPARQHRTLLLDPTQHEAIARQPIEWRGRLARHELAHIEHPELTEEQIQAVAEWAIGETDPNASMSAVEISRSEDFAAAMRGVPGGSYSNSKLAAAAGIARGTYSRVLASEKIRRIHQENERRKREQTGLAPIILIDVSNEELREQTLRAIDEHVSDIPPGDHFLTDLSSYLHITAMTIHKHEAYILAKIAELNAQKKLRDEPTINIISRGVVWRVQQALPTTKGGSYYWTQLADLWGIGWVSLQNHLKEIEDLLAVENERRKEDPKAVPIEILKAPAAGSVLQSFAEGLPNVDPGIYSLGRLAELAGSSYEVIYQYRDEAAELVSAENIRRSGLVTPIRPIEIRELGDILPRIAAALPGIAPGSYSLTAFAQAVGVSQTSITTNLTEVQNLLAAHNHARPSAAIFLESPVIFERLLHDYAPALQEGLLNEDWLRRAFSAGPAGVSELLSELTDSGTASLCRVLVLVELYPFLFERLYVDMDDTLFTSPLFVGSEAWIRSEYALHGRPISHLKNEKRRIEGWLIHSGVPFQAVEPLVPEKLLQIQQRYPHIQIIGLTARGQEDRSNTESILKQLGLSIEVLYGGSSYGKRQQWNQARTAAGRLQTSGTANAQPESESDETDSDEDQSAAQPEDTTSGQNEQARRWWVLLDDGLDRLAKKPQRESWLDEQIAAVGYAPPIRYDWSASRDHMLQDLESGDLISSWRWAMDALALLKYEPDTRRRLETLAQIQALVVEPAFARMQAEQPHPDEVEGIDRLLVGYVEAVTALLAQGPAELAETVGIDWTEYVAYSAFLILMPNNAEDFTNAYMNGLLPIREVSRQSRGLPEANYFIEMTPENIFLFMEPLIRYLRTEKPSLVVLPDTGARPFFDLLNKVIEAEGLPTKLLIFPISRNTASDTLYELKLWMTSQQTRFTRLFQGIDPSGVAGKDVVILDDNITSGETILMLQTLLKDVWGAGTIVGLTPFAYRRGYPFPFIATCVLPAQGFAWRRQNPPVVVITPWENSPTLRGAASRSRFERPPVKLIQSPKNQAAAIERLQQFMGAYGASNRDLTLTLKETAEEPFPFMEIAGSSQSAEPSPSEAERSESIVAIPISNSVELRELGRRLPGWVRTEYALTKEELPHATEPETMLYEIWDKQTDEPLGLCILLWVWDENNNRNILIRKIQPRIAADDRVDPVQLIEGIRNWLETEPIDLHALLIDANSITMTRVSESHRVRALINDAYASHPRVRDQLTTQGYAHPWIGQANVVFIKRLTPEERARIAEGRALLENISQSRLNRILHPDLLSQFNDASILLNSGLPPSEEDLALLRVLQRHDALLRYAASAEAKRNPEQLERYGTRILYDSLVEASELSGERLSFPEGFFEGDYGRVRAEEAFLYYIQNIWEDGYHLGQLRTADLRQYGLGPALRLHFNNDRGALIEFLCPGGYVQSGKNRYRPNPEQEVTSRMWAHFMAGEWWTIAPGARYTLKANDKAGDRYRGLVASFEVNANHGPIAILRDVAGVEHAIAHQVDQSHVASTSVRLAKYRLFKRKSTAGPLLAALNIHRWLAGHHIQVSAEMQPVTMPSQQVNQLMRWRSVKGVNKLYNPAVSLVPEQDPALGTVLRIYAPQPGKELAEADLVGICFRDSNGVIIYETLAEQLGAVDIDAWIRGLPVTPLARSGNFFRLSQTGQLLAQLPGNRKSRPVSVDSSYANQIVFARLENHAAYGTLLAVYPVDPTTGIVQSNQRIRAYAWVEDELRALAGGIVPYEEQFPTPSPEFSSDEAQSKEGDHPDEAVSLPEPREGDAVRAERGGVWRNTTILRIVPGKYIFVSWRNVELGIPWEKIQTHLQRADGSPLMQSEESSPETDSAASAPPEETLLLSQVAFSDSSTGEKIVSLLADKDIRTVADLLARGADPFIAVDDGYALNRDDWQELDLALGLLGAPILMDPAATADSDSTESLPIQGPLRKSRVIYGLWRLHILSLSELAHRFDRARPALAASLSPDELLRVEDWLTEQGYAIVSEPVEPAYLPSHQTFSTSRIRRMIQAILPDFPGGEFTYKEFSELTGIDPATISTNRVLIDQLVAAENAIRERASRQTIRLGEDILQKIEGLLPETPGGEYTLKDLGGLWGLSPPTLAKYREEIDLLVEQENNDPGRESPEDEIQLYEPDPLVRIAAAFKEVRGGTYSAEKLARALHTALPTFNKYEAEILALLEKENESLKTQGKPQIEYRPRAVLKRIRADLPNLPGGNYSIKSFSEAMVITRSSVPKFEPEIQAMIIEVNALRKEQQRTDFIHLSAQPAVNTSEILFDEIIQRISTIPAGEYTWSGLARELKAGKGYVIGKQKKLTTVIAADNVAREKRNEGPIVIIAPDRMEDLAARLPKVQGKVYQMKDFAEAVGISQSVLNRHSTEVDALLLTDNIRRKAANEPEIALWEQDSFLKIEQLIPSLAGGWYSFDDLAELVHAHRKTLASYADEIERLMGAENLKRRQAGRKDFVFLLRKPVLPRVRQVLPWLDGGTYSWEDLAAATGLEAKTLSYNYRDAVLEIIAAENLNRSPDNQIILLSKQSPSSQALAGRFDGADLRQAEPIEDAETTQLIDAAGVISENFKDVLGGVEAELPALQQQTDQQEEPLSGKKKLTFKLVAFRNAAGEIEARGPYIQRTGSVIYLNAGRADLSVENKRRALKHDIIGHDWQLLMDTLGYASPEKIPHAIAEAFGLYMGEFSDISDTEERIELVLAILEQRLGMVIPVNGEPASMTAAPSQADFCPSLLHSRNPTRALPRHEIADALRKLPDIQTLYIEHANPITATSIRNKLLNTGLTHIRQLEELTPEELNALLGRRADEAAVMAIEAALQRLGKSLSAFDSIDTLKIPGTSDRQRTRLLIILKSNGILTIPKLLETPDAKLEGILAGASMIGETPINYLMLRIRELRDATPMKPSSTQAAMIHVGVNATGIPSFSAEGQSELDQLLAQMCSSLNNTMENPTEDLELLIKNWQRQREEIESSG